MKRNTQICDEAADWLIEFRTGEVDARTRQRFDAWWRRSPEHIGAYLELAAIWNEGHHLAREPQWDVDSLIARARSSGEDFSNIVPLTGVPDSEDGTPRPSEAETSRAARVPTRRPHRLRALYAAAACGLLIGAFLVGWLYVQRGTYMTDVGEQRSIALADGSTIALNSRSRIHVHFSERERTVDLVRGQALFHVAKDSTRPFVVQSDSARVRALGTQFDVYRRDGGTTTVTVLEGSVAVLALAPAADSGSPRETSSHSGPSIESTLLAAGEQVTVTAQAPPHPVHANVAAATAWTQRRLVFEAATLEEVAAEFNRYNTRQLVLIDPTLTFHVNAVFTTTDVSALLQFLQDRPEVVVIDHGNRLEIRHR